MRSILAVAVLVPLVAGYAVDAARQTSGAAQPPPSLPFQIQMVADFESPWAMTFLPDGRMFFSGHDPDVFGLRPEAGLDDLERLVIDGHVDEQPARDGCGPQGSVERDAKLNRPRRVLRGRGRRRAKTQDEESGQDRLDEEPHDVPCAGSNSWMRDARQ